MAVYKRTSKGRLVKVVRAETDPMALRVSMGGTKQKGFYLVYRGNKEEEIKELLETCMEALDMHMEEKKKSIAG